MGIIGGLAVAAAAAFDAAYVTSVSSSASQTTYTFNTVSIGAAHANRRVAIGINVGGSGLGTLAGIASATIGGVAATIVGTAGQVSQGTAGIAYADVAAGTTATIVINTNGSTPAFCVVNVYRLITTSATVDSAGSVSASASALVCDNVAVLPNGFIICCGQGFGQTPSANYNGVDTPVANSSLDISSYKIFAWSCATTENNTTRDAGFSWTGNTSQAIIAASFVA